jgi:quinol-cytochrome oxidoreductase complex cytochrome b subunit
MAQYALDLIKQKESALIKSILSIFITFAGVLSMYIMNDAFPDIANTWYRIVINIPSLCLFAIAIYTLITDIEVEW